MTWRASTPCKRLSSAAYAIVSRLTRLLWVKSKASGRVHVVSTLSPRHLHGVRGASHTLHLAGRHVAAPARRVGSDKSYIAGRLEYATSASDRRAQAPTTYRVRQPLADRYCGHSSLGALDAPPQVQSPE